MSDTKNKTCEGTTKAGKPCGMQIQESEQFCHHHKQEKPLTYNTQMTPQLKKFCAHYVLNGSNATQAYLDAYPNCTSRGSANTSSSALLKRPYIIEYLQNLHDEDPLVASAEERARFWTSVMRDGSESTKDRLKAAETLGKVHGDFIDRVEISGRGGGPVEMITALSDEELEEKLKVLSEINSLGTEDDD